jgi:acetylornithine deacetylase/succinyl-diaminopimelate desuccinylase-like protein
MSTAPSFEPSRRLASRIALYASLTLTVVLGAGLVAVIDRPASSNEAERWLAIDYPRLPEVRLLQRYVQIDTSEATGDELRGARFLAAQLEAAGIHPTIETVGRHALLYARVDGLDPHPLVLHNHIDVSDVDPKQWFSPPFEARIELPWMYGRGVFDMKSVALAQLLALVDVKRSGRPLKRSVVFLATGDEETGSRLGARWFIRAHPDLVAGFWAVLTEGGTVEAVTRSQVKYWGTEVAQKHYADLVVCGPSRERLEALRESLLHAATETELTLAPVVRQVLALYGPTRSSAVLREALSPPEGPLTDVARFRRLPPFVRSMLRNEAVPFDVGPSPGGGWQMIVKFQLLPGQRLADVRDRLVPPWMLHGLATRIDDPEADGPPSPTDHPVFRQILGAIHDEFPDAPAGPFFLAWTATDARFFRAAGVPSYGFSPFLIMNTDTLQVDNANERLALTGYVQGVRMYRELLRRLLLS